MIPCSRSRAVYGFTLVELLVVIAIIGVLASIMVPVFSSARGASKKTVCQSNLRQLYTAFQLYAQDWEDTLPCPGGQKDEISWSMDEGGGIDAYLHNQNMGGKSVYCCPSYIGRWNSIYSPRTYGMNSYLRGVRTDRDAYRPDGTADAILDLSGIPQGMIESLSGTILLYEGYSADSTYADRDSSRLEGYVYRCGNWTCVAGYYANKKLHWQNANKTWHREFNNYLMCDGHVMSMRPEKERAFTGPTLDNNLWYARKLR